MHILSAKIQGPIYGPDYTQYLQGPRSAEKVKRHGYGFTDDPDKSWPFESRAKAAAKARIVTRHMGWNADRIKIETLNADENIQTRK